MVGHKLTAGGAPSTSSAKAPTRSSLRPSLMRKAKSTAGKTSTKTKTTLSKTKKKTAPIVEIESASDDEGA